MAVPTTLSVKIVRGLVKICKNTFRHHRNHCMHCDGRKGPCSCTFGCAPGQRDLCMHYHEHVSCRSCDLKGMPGDRFKCRHCYDYNLCSGCYIGGAHDSNHAFMKMERAGVPPTFVPPRSGAPTAQNIIMESANPTTPAFDPNPSAPQPIPAKQSAFGSNTPQKSNGKVSSNIGVSPGFNDASSWCNNLHTHSKCLPS